MKGEKLYWMAISADEYELPIAVAESAPELAQMLGIKTTTVYEKMSRDRHRERSRGRYAEYRIITISR